MGERRNKGAVDVSPDMIDVGLLELYRYHPDRGEDAEATVSRIFLTMYAIFLEKRLSDPSVESVLRRLGRVS